MPDVDFRAIFESIPGLYLVLAPDLQIIAVSDAYLRATMTTREGIVGRPLFEVFPDDPADPNGSGVANLRASLDRVRSTGQPDVMAIQKYDIRRPDGTFEVRYWIPRNHPGFDADGKLVHIVHSAEDVTEASRHEERRIELDGSNVALQQVAAMLDGVVEHLPDMVFVKDADNLTFVRVNRAAEDLLGLQRRELYGKTDYDFFPADEAAFFQAKDRETLAKDGVVDILEEPIMTARGKRWLHTRKIAIRPMRGAGGYLVGISSDITEKKVAEAALRRATDALEIANKELEAFSYSVAHDLRAPLRSIDGFSQAVIEDYGDKLDDTGREYLRFVREASKQMARLIDDLLALSRVTRSDLNREPVDLTALAETVLARLRRADPTREVVVSVAPGMACRGDPRLLAIVLDNLVGNAWKFTGKRPDARIELGASEGCWYVRDNGAGFDPRYAARLFGVFQRLHGSTEFEGTGIGLATVHRIVQRHGGKVWATAEVGQGATFSFTLGDDT